MKSTQEKIMSRRDLAATLEKLRREGRKVVFTNGCFDILHPGHVRYLERARALGDILVVALNSDVSVRRLKGPERPVQAERDRCEIVAGLGCVGFVTIFEEDTPREIIDELMPDVLVKGADWTLDNIVGRDLVESRGGLVFALEFEEGFSTSRIIEKIRRSRQDRPASR